MEVASEAGGDKGDSQGQWEKMQEMKSHWCKGDKGTQKSLVSDLWHTRKVP